MGQFPDAANDALMWEQVSVAQSAELWYARARHIPELTAVVHCSGLTSGENHPRVVCDGWCLMTLMKEPHHFFTKWFRNNKTAILQQQPLEH